MPWRELDSESQHWRFIATLPFSSGLFLQSPAWALFQKKQSRESLCLGWWQGNELRGVAVLVRYHLPFGYWYWFVPKGPRFISSVTPQETLQAYAELSQLGGKSASIFIRLEPAIKPVKFFRAREVNPRATSVVNLLPAWDKILANMHEKTRYNMRLAMRKGLKFRWGGLNDFAKFWQLLKTTASREKFRTHEANHYRSMLELFNEAPLETPELACRMGLVEWSGKLLAASLIVVCNKHATYLHGASSREQRELMAPYLLHGEAMCLLKEAGCQSYDLWGVQPKDGSLKKWAGFTRFKLGWGGNYCEEPGTFDYALRPWPYFAYRLLRNLK